MAEMSHARGWTAQRCPTGDWRNFYHCQDCGKPQKHGHPGSRCKDCYLAYNAKYKEVTQFIRFGKKEYKYRRQQRDAYCASLGKFKYDALHNAISLETPVGIGEYDGTLADLISDIELDDPGELVEAMESVVLRLIDDGHSRSEAEKIVATAAGSL